MKKRNGFVSNSSSTSFIVAIEKPKKNNLSDPSAMIDFLIKHSKVNYEDLKFFTKTPKQYRNTVQKEIKELRYDIKWSEEQQSILKEALENETVMAILGKLDYIERYRKIAEMNTDQLRILRQYRRSVKKELESNVEAMGNRVKYNQQKIKELQEKEEKIKPYLDGNWKLIGFEEDHWGDILKSAIEEMAEKGNAVIIEKVST